MNGALLWDQNRARNSNRIVFVNKWVNKTNISNWVENAEASSIKIKKKLGETQIIAILQIQSEKSGQRWFDPVGLRVCWNVGSFRSNWWIDVSIKFIIKSYVEKIMYISHVWPFHKFFCKTSLPSVIQLLPPAPWILMFMWMVTHWMSKKYYHTLSSRSLHPW